MSVFAFVRKLLRRILPSKKTKKLNEAYRSDEFYFYEKKQPLILKSNAITINQRPNKKHN